MLLSVDSQCNINQILVFRTLRLEPLKHIGIDTYHDWHSPFRESQLCLGKESVIQGRNVGSINLLIS